MSRLLAPVAPGRCERLVTARFPLFESKTIGRRPKRTARRSAGAEKRSGIQAGEDLDELMVNLQEEITQL